MTGLRPRTLDVQTFRIVWSAIRDVATWGLGAYWGNGLMETEGPVDLARLAFVATCLGLPFVFRADELRQRQPSKVEQSVNGTAPAVDRESAEP